MSLLRAIGMWVLGIGMVYLTVRLAFTPVGIIAITVVAAGCIVAMGIVILSAALAAMVGTVMAWVIPTVLLPVSLPYSLYRYWRDRDAPA